MKASFMTQPSRRSNLHLTENIGRLRKALVETHERFAAFRLHKMKRIGKIHALLHPSQRLCDQSRIFELDARQSGEGSKRLGQWGGGTTVDAAQHPFGLQ